MSSVCVDVGFICLLLLAFTHPLVGDVACRYAKQRGFFTAECSNMNLQSVPVNLRSDIEVLDLSSNRLRELKNHTFKCCTSIKMLYLNINSIFNIEADVFQPLTSLEVLDLSVNVLLEFPRNLPPTLRRLYLDDNPPHIFTLNETSVGKSYELKIAAWKNLEYLSIAQCNLPKFPSFGGSIPNLVQLNITGNPIKEITPDDLAPLCQLKYLHVSPDWLFQQPDKLCSCAKLEAWTTLYDIKVEYYTCKYDKSNTIEKCDTKPSNVTLAKYNSCLTEMKNRQIPYWLMFGGGILAAIICVSILLYVRYRRRQREASPKSARKNSSVKYENSKPEENNERPEEDKLLKQ